MDNIIIDRTGTSKVAGDKVDSLEYEIKDGVVKVLTKGFYHTIRLYGEWKIETLGDVESKKLFDSILPEDIRWTSDTIVDKLWHWLNPKKWKKIKMRCVKGSYTTYDPDDVTEYTFAMENVNIVDVVERG